MKNLLIVSLLILLFPVSSLATHIVGGELTYSCLGNNQYEIKLKLYRNCFNPCGSCSYPDPARIHLFNGEDGNYAGITFDIPFPGMVVLPNVVGNICFIPPTNVCVEEAIYIDTVTIAPRVGGYDIVYNICCRNSSILNIVTPLSTEATYYSTIDYQLQADSAGFNGAQIDAEGGNCGGNSGWTPLSGNIVSSDNTYDSIVVNSTNYNETTCYLEATDFGFNLPPGVITGIEVQIEKSSNAIGAVADSSVQIILGGTIQGIGSEHANVADWPGTDSVFTYGGPGDLWGTTWTVADINANNFGVAIQPLDKEPDVLIWLEDFEDRTIGDEVDLGATSWYTTCTAGPSPPNVCGLNDPDSDDYFEVRSNGNLVYEGRDLDAEAVWTSDSIDISAYPSGVSISIDLFENSYDDGNDWIEAYYKLDGGAEIALTNGIQSGNFNNATATANGLIGTKLETVVRVMNTGGGDRGSFDDVRITATKNNTFYVDFVGIKIYYDSLVDICNTTPEFNNFPPMFVCLGDTLKFDHSAGDTLADVDGDSLVYSLCTPYDDTQTSYDTPDIPGAGVFTPPTLITWTGGYAADNQLPGDTLTIDPVTGYMQGVPNILGQYLLGVCVSEYRNDTLLTINKRDFQFNVVNCVPIISSSVPSPNLPCGGTTVSFQNDSAGAITYDWDFGVPVITTDTSTQATPTYTFPDTGTYLVTLIINQGMTCADTGTTLVDLHPAVEANFSTTNACLGAITNFNDSSTTTFGTIASWSWDFGDASTSTAQNPTHTYADSGTYNVTLIATNDSACSDTVTLPVIIYPLPIADAGLNDSACMDSSILLNGTILNATSGQWSTSGTGTFSPSVDSLSTSYTPSAADLSAGSVYLTLTTTGSLGGCIDDSDSSLLSFIPNPTALAGTDTTLCANIPSISLSGSIVNAGGGSWSTSGSGTFSPSSTDLNATYSFTAGDTALGTIDLILNTTSNGTCSAGRDTLTIIFTPAPVVNVGPDNSVCANVVYTLSGTIITATGGVWTTSGSGTFNDSTMLNATYTASAADTAFGSVVLTLTSTGNGSCGAESDSMILTLTNAPQANAGSDISLCVDSTTATISGTISIGTTTGVWSTSGSGTFGDSTALTTTYTPSAADTASGSVTITLSSTLNGACNPAVDSLLITYVNFPTVDAGPDQAACANGSLGLNGSVTSATGGTWTTLGSGTFSPSADSLITTYLPSAADTTAGSIIAILTTTGNGGCAAISDSITLTFIAEPSVNAGPDILVCALIDSAQLSGSVSGLGIGAWSSTGIGTFSPGDSVLNPFYSPIDAGFDTLTLTAASGCPISDTLIMEVIDGAVVNVDPRISVCKTNPNASFSGTVTGGSVLGWSSSGAGIFLPNDTALSVTYIPAAADTAAGSVTITLTADSVGPCVGSDQLVITYTPDQITAYAGADTVVCKSVTSVSISGTVTIASGGLWTTQGTGTFGDSADLTTTYIPSSVDTAAGSVTLVLSTTGNGGCLATSDTVVISFYPELTVLAGSDTVLCIETDSLPLAGLISGGGSGIWSTSGTGSFAPSDTLLNSYYLFTQQDFFTGTVYLYLTSSSSGFCAVTDTMRVTIIPVAFAGPDQYLCLTDDSVYLNGSVGGATGGIWTCDPPCTGTFFPSDTLLATTYIISSADSAAGSVTLVLTSTGNLGGCPSATDTTEAFVIPEPTVDAGPDSLYVCSNMGIANLSGTLTNALGGVWTSSGTGTFSPSADSLATSYAMDSADLAQPYIVLTLTTSGSCLNPSDSVVLKIIPGPIVDFSYSEVCVNELISFSDITPDSVSNWFWDFGDGVMDSVQNPSHLYSAEGIYTVMLAVITANGCMDTTTKPVLVHSIPVAEFSSIANCESDIASFTDLSTVTFDSIIEWVWDFGNGDSATIQNPTELFTGEADYNVTLIASSTWGCSDTVTHIVSIVPDPIANFTFAPACHPDPVVYMDSSYIDNSIAPHNIVSWYWDFGDGSAIDSMQTPTPHVYPGAGTYTVQLIVISDDGCSDTITKSISVFDKPVAAYSYTNVCELDTAFFIDSSYVVSPDVIVSWEWFFGDGTTTTTLDPSHIYSSYGSYIVDLIVATNNGCTDTLQQLLIVSPNPVADFTADNFVVTTEDEVSFTDLSLGTNTFPDTVPIVDWFWDFYYPTNGNGDSVAILIQNPTHSYADTGTYNVQLIVTNFYGCTDTAYNTIEVGLNPVVASGFSPDGSGENGNNVLVVHGGPYQKLLFIIYNEWGEIIFQSENQDYGWDGTFDGVPQPIGVYVYTVQATSIDGVEHHFWGDVTLLR